ncbi:MAG TPA: sensor histidine kinase [Gaiellales bacterium]|nr:sensor histidine kinase [Gaiellales bacterium]
MTQAEPAADYLSALSAYTRQAEERALLWAYDFGREALSSGLGVLDVAGVYHEAVAGLLEDAGSGPDAAELFRMSWPFLAESLAPLEMSLTGYRQANAALRTLTETLEDQVAARTRELDASLEALTEADGARRLLLERLVSAQEDERRRVAADIHDDSIQAITAAYLRVQLLHQTLGDDPRAEALGPLDAALRESIDRLRHLIFALRPAVLDTAGVGPTLEVFVEQWRAKSGTQVSFENRLRREPSSVVGTTVYRIAAEALTNVRKHARATAVSVTVRERGRGVELRVRDDGVGLDPRHLHEPTEHFGIAMMAERATMAGGWCQAESNAPDPGTTVTAWVPNDRDRPGRVPRPPGWSENGAGNPSDPRDHR